MRLELLARLARELVGGGGELLLDFGESLPLRLAGGVEALGVQRKARLGSRHQPFLPVAERLQLRGERLFRPLEVGVQLAEALRDALLHLREGLAQLSAGAVLTLGERRPSLLRDPPFLHDELRERVGTSACQRALELRGAGVSGGRNRGIEAGLCLLEPPIHVLRAADEAQHRDRPELEDGADGEAACRDRELGRRIEREHNPPDRRCNAQKRGQREEELPRRATHDGGRSGCEHDHDRSCEHELEDVRAHAPHATPGGTPAAQPPERRSPRPASAGHARARPPASRA